MTNEGKYDVEAAIEHTKTYVVDKDVLSKSIAMYKGCSTGKVLIKLLGKSQ